MGRAENILIIIPALNEAESIGGVLADLKQYAPDTTPLVIDDGSSDLTGDVAKANGAMVVRHPFNMGVGSALRTGFKFALRHDFDCAIQFDADGQHKADQIEKLVTAVRDGTSLAIGSRFTGDREKSDRYQTGLVRRSAMRLLQFLIRIILGIRISDTSSGFRAFDGATLKLLAEKLPRDYLSDTVEALLLVGYAGLQIKEVPVTMSDRTAGIASARSWRLFYHYIRIMVIILVTVSSKGRRPQT